MMTSNWQDKMLATFGGPRAGRSKASEAQTMDNNANKNEVMEDVVREPQHYQHGIFEVIDEMIIVFGVEATMQFCRMNAWKYRARAPYKGKMEQDMDKANRYLEMAYEMSQIRQEYPEADNYEVVFLLKGRVEKGESDGSGK